MIAPGRRAARPWWFPTLAGYRRSWLGRDLLAGLATGAVIIPQAMAYATIAGMPVEIGLYTCIVPLLVYAAFGGSPTTSSSTTSTIATLTASTLVGVGVASAATRDQDSVLGNLAMLVLLTGAFLLLARLFRLGGLVENISEATLVGIKVGVGLTVAVGQLPALLGITADTAGKGFIRALDAIVAQIGNANLATVLLSAGSVVLLYLLPRLVPRLPTTLVVVAVGIVLVATTSITDRGVAPIAPVPSGLPSFSLPDFHHVGALVPGALAIAVMAFLETVSVARNMRKSSEPPIDSDQELLAAGLCCVGGAFTSTLPSAGGFSQSAVNGQSGARSQLAGITTAVLAVLVALFLSPVLDNLPQATLAAIVFVAVLGLVDIRELTQLWKINRTEFWLAGMTALLGLTAGLLAAVAFGVIATLFLVLREVDRPMLTPLARLEPGVWVPAAEAGTLPPAGVLVLAAGRGLYAASVRGTAEAVEGLVDGENEAGRPVRAVVLDLSRQPALTTSVLKGLRDLYQELDSRGAALYLTRIPPEAVERAKMLDWVAEWADNATISATVDQAVAAAESG